MTRDGMSARIDSLLNDLFLKIHVPGLMVDERPDDARELSNRTRIRQRLAQLERAAIAQVFYCVTRELNAARTYFQGFRHTEPSVSGPAHCELNALIQRVLEARPQAAQLSGIVVTQDLEPSLPEVSAHPVDIEHVLFTLISNAENAILDRDSEGHIHIRTYLKDGSVRLVVTDNGRGMRSSVSLYVCGEIAQEHNGRLQQWIAHAGGSTTTLELMAVKGSAHGSMESAPSVMTELQ